MFLNWFVYLRLFQCQENLAPYVFSLYYYSALRIGQRTRAHPERRVFRISLMFKLQLKYQNSTTLSILFQ